MKDEELLARLEERVERILEVLTELKESNKNQQEKISKLYGKVIVHSATIELIKEKLDVTFNNELAHIKSKINKISYIVFVLIIIVAVSSPTVSKLVTGFLRYLF